MIVTGILSTTVLAVYISPEPSNYVKGQSAKLFGNFRTALEVASSLHEHLGTDVDSMTEEQRARRVQEEGAGMFLTDCEALAS